MYFYVGPVYHSEWQFPAVSCTVWELFPSYSLSYLRLRTRIYSLWSSYHLPQSNFSINICWIIEQTVWSQLVQTVSQLPQGGLPPTTRPLTAPPQETFPISESYSVPSLQGKFCHTRPCLDHNEVLRKQWNEDSLQEWIETWKPPRMEIVPFWCFYHLNLTAVATKIWDSFVTLPSPCSLLLETCITHGFHLFSPK